MAWGMRDGRLRKSLAIARKSRLAWDGLAPDPDEPASARRKIAAKKHTDPASSMASMRVDDDAALAAVPKYSKEWVKLLHAAKQERDDEKLDRAIVICRGC